MIDILNYKLPEQLDIKDVKELAEIGYQLKKEVRLHKRGHKQNNYFTDNINNKMNIYDFILMQFEMIKIAKAYENEESIEGLLSVELDSKSIEKRVLEAIASQKFYNNINIPKNIEKYLTEKRLDIIKKKLDDLKEEKAQDLINDESRKVAWSKKTQKEKDDIYRASAIYHMRDWNYVTLDIEYDFINKQKKFGGYDVFTEEVKIKLAYMKEDENFHFVSQENNVLSPFYQRNIEIEGLTFRSVYHYLRYAKAEIWRDRENMELILNSKNDKEVKSISLTHIPRDVWNMVKTNEMKKVYKYLFENEEAFKSALIGTKGKTIVFNKYSDWSVSDFKLNPFLERRKKEGKPILSDWNNGLFYNDPRNNNRKDWFGKNHLGEFLTVLRVQLKGEY